MDDTPLPQRVRRRREAENVVGDEKNHNKILPEVSQPSANKLLEHAHDTMENISPKKRKASRDIERLPQLEKFEYLDHTADIQFHSWGDSAGEAFANAVVCMFGYMTELEYVDIDPTISKEVQVEGHDMFSLLYNFMDECLFLFCTDGFIFRTLDILEMDTTNFRMKAVGYGETFDEQKHPKGTEIKAITYSNMQILQNAEGTEHPWDLYVIVDI